MGKRGRTPEQIIGKLREAEIELAKGKTVGEVCRKLAVTEQTYYRWRKEYGGLRMDQARRLKELETENGRLSPYPSASLEEASFLIFLLWAGVAVWWLIDFLLVPGIPRKYNSQLAQRLGQS